MSIPTVGSSMIRMRVLAASHFAIETFCWFPPESLPTGCASDGVPHVEPAHERLDRPRLRPRRDQP